MPEWFYKGVDIDFFLSRRAGKISVQALIGKNKKNFKIFSKKEGFLEFM